MCSRAAPAFMRAIAVREGMPEEDALKAVTINAARAQELMTGLVVLKLERMPIL